jgi:hypothetical protein
LGGERAASAPLASSLGASYRGASTTGGW